MRKRDEERLYTGRSGNTFTGALEPAGFTAQAGDQVTFQNDLDFSGMAVDPNNANLAFVTSANFSDLTGGGHVWMTTKGGAPNSWINISGSGATGLPDTPVWSIQEQPGANGGLPVLYVGTDLGVYISTNEGQTWAKLGPGLGQPGALPNVQVRSMDLYLNPSNPAQNLLLVGTFGHGAYEITPQAAVSLSESGNTFKESGGSITITARLNMASAGAVTIPLTFSGTAVKGTDYNASATSITINPGSTSGTITLTGLHNPSFGLSSKSVIVGLGSITGGIAGSPSSVTATITPVPQQTIGTFDPSTGTWYLRNSNSAGGANTFSSTALPAGIPSSATGTATALTTIGVVDLQTETWYLRNSNSAGGVTTRPSNSVLPAGYLLSATGTATVTPASVSSTRPPVPGICATKSAAAAPMPGPSNSAARTGRRWSATGTVRATPPSASSIPPPKPGISATATAAVRPSFTPFVFGAPGWVPVAGDWNSTGHSGIGVVNGASANWYSAQRGRWRRRRRGNLSVRWWWLGLRGRRLGLPGLAAVGCVRRGGRSLRCGTVDRRATPVGGAGGAELCWRPTA